jgi:glutamate dehydrogenase/leucine dehydrogenase
MSQEMTLEEMFAVFERAGITFAYVVRSNGELVTSHKELEPLRDLVQQSPGFADHEGVFVGRNPRFKTLFFVFVHSTSRGLAQGGLRLNNYPDVASVLNDGLRLARGMSRKNAISGLFWGGGKGIIPKTEALINETFDGDREMKDREKRDALFGAFGAFVARLNGLYYTAADIGTYNRDMEAILAKNRFVTCVPKELGGSGDPSPHTAEGVFRAIRVARAHLTGSEELQGVTVAVQGVGKVGRPLIKKLVAAGAKVWASDERFETSPLALADFRATFPSAEVVPCGPGHEDDIFGLDVEVVSPCAVGGTVNRRTIKLLKPTVKLVCGGANNILWVEEEDGEVLYREGIVFIPDFVCNWMGIVNCANEVFGYLEDDVEDALNRVAPTVKAVLETSDRDNISHTAAAHRLADEKIKEQPPDELRRNRGQRIISRLIDPYRSGAAHAVR